MGGLFNHPPRPLRAPAERRAVSRPLAISLLATIALVLGFAVTTAQDAAPHELASHPLVGTWVLDTNVDDPADAPEMIVVSADGGYISVDAEGTTTVGVWEATGDWTANLTVSTPQLTSDGSFGGTIVLRAAVEVEPSGNAFTATYTFELVWPDGAHTGEHGPGSAQGTRLVAEPVGTPVGSLSEIFEGVAEATPAG